MDGRLELGRQATNRESGSKVDGRQIQKMVIVPLAKIVIHHRLDDGMTGEDAKGAESRKSAAGRRRGLPGLIDYRGDVARTAGCWDSGMCDLYRDTNGRGRQLRY